MFEFKQNVNVVQTKPINNLNKLFNKKGPKSSQ